VAWKEKNKGTNYAPQGNAYDSVNLDAKVLTHVRISRNETSLRIENDASKDTPNTIHIVNT